MLLASQSTKAKSHLSGSQGAARFYNFIILVLAFHSLRLHFGVAFHYTAFVFTSALRSTTQPSSPGCASLARFYNFGLDHAASFQADLRFSDFIFRLRAVSGIGGFSWVGSFSSIAHLFKALSYRIFAALFHFRLEHSILCALLLFTLALQLNHSSITSLAFT